MKFVAALGLIVLFLGFAVPALAPGTVDNINVLGVMTFTPGNPAFPSLSGMDVAQGTVVSSQQGLLQAPFLEDNGPPAGGLNFVFIWCSGANCQPSFQVPANQVEATYLNGYYYMATETPVLTPGIPYSFLLIAQPSSGNTASELVTITYNGQATTSTTSTASTQSTTRTTVIITTSGTTATVTISGCIASGGGPCKSSSSPDWYVVGIGGFVAAVGFVLPSGSARRLKRKVG